MVLFTFERYKPIIELFAHLGVFDNLDQLKLIGYYLAI